MSGEALVARNVAYRTGERAVLEHVTLSAHPGEMVGISGASGSGKTTLLLLLAGLDRPTQGAVSLGDRPVIIDRVSMVFQHFGLISYLTAAENVALPLQGRGRARTVVSELVRDALVRVGLGELADRAADQLSGGQQQRVAVARALVGEPDLLIADEPTSELDAENRSKVVALFAARVRAGGIVVLSSDDSDVLEACDRRLHLVDGRISSIA